MEHKTFGGGVHPPELKTTSGAAIKSLPLPRKVILPVSQHIGAPAKVKVAVGDQVKCGDMVAESGGFVSAPVHATISGKVVAIGNFPHPMGVATLAVVIEADQDYSEPGFATVSDGLSLSVEDIKSYIQAAGIVGMGGAAFPTIVKLSPPANKPIDTLVINGVECEPALTSDHRVMLEHSQKVFSGIQILMKVLGAKKAVIGIEGNKPDAIKHFQETYGKHSFLEVCPLELKYPQGGEKQLIAASLQREVPSGGLPMDVGVVVQNVATCAAVHDAVCLRKPLIERVVTLSGGSVQNPGNYLVRIGTTIKDFVDMTGGIKADNQPRKVISGGPMMGHALGDMSSPILKGTSGILCWGDKEAQGTDPQVCIRCGRCIEACPMHLLPQKIKNFLDAERFEDCDQCGVLDCIECGSCSFICPAKLPLIQSIRLGKKEVFAIRKQKASEKQEKKS
jgi:electron transport complex protein RnfC